MLRPRLGYDPAMSAVTDVEQSTRNFAQRNSGWVKGAATFNPITLVLEANRGFLEGDPVKVLPAFLVVAALASLSLVWARGGLRSAERAA